VKVKRGAPVVTPAGSLGCPGRIKKLLKAEKIDLITHHSKID
jgi:hypothetical protein